MQRYLSSCSKAFYSLLLIDALPCDFTFWRNYKHWSKEGTFGSEKMSLFKDIKEIDIAVNHVEILIVKTQLR
jgi:hypothetical protein